MTQYKVDTRKKKKLDRPSSTETRMLPSGLRAIEEIFLRFSKANVKDLLLFGRKVVNVERLYEVIRMQRTLQGRTLTLDYQLGCRASCHRE